MVNVPALIFVFAIGAVFGSFLNVLIYRVPRKIPFATGRSHCPSCKEKIKFFDNIPLLSYLILGGKCRSCGARIPWRYPLVELLNGAGYAYLLWIFGFTLQFYMFAYLTSVLITIFFIDFDFQIIPDVVSIPSMIVGLGLSLAPGGVGIMASGIGFIVGGGVLYLIALLGDWIFKKESMGGGDIKMAAMLGAFLGWQKVVLVFFGSAVVGLLVSIIIMAFSSKLRSNRVVPFGPFLAIAAFIAILFGDKIIAFYLDNFFPV